MQCSSKAFLRVHKRITSLRKDGERKRPEATDGKEGSGPTIPTASRNVLVVKVAPYVYFFLLTL